jgi:hypothetical protein
VLRLGAENTLSFFGSSGCAASSLTKNNPAIWCSSIISKKHIGTPFEFLVLFDQICLQATNLSIHGGGSI